MRSVYVNAGERDQQVTLQAKSVTRNALGEEVVTWINEATFWARVSPLRGREFVAGAQFTGSGDTLFVSAFRTDVTPGKRLLWRGAPFDVTYAQDREGGRTALEIVGASEVHDARQ